MRFHSFGLHPYERFLNTGCIRRGLWIELQEETGRSSWAESAPLLGRSVETLEEVKSQLERALESSLTTEWSLDTYAHHLERLKLFPSAAFGLESALLALLDPLPAVRVNVSALLQGTPQEVMAQAELREREGYTSAKLKVGHLTLEHAEGLIRKLLGRFRLRLDVNRAWKRQEAERFFDAFEPNTFEYVEEPFQNPHELIHFSHPLAVDESFPHDLTLTQLEALPTLKALIYKPTMQGGLSECRKLHQWTVRRGISLVLSSSFESEIGLSHIASLAYRLGIKTPIGIGTFHHFIHPSRMPGATLQHTAHDKKEGFEQPVMTHSLESILRASGIKATAGAQERTHHQLISAD